MKVKRDFLFDVPILLYSVDVLLNIFNIRDGGYLMKIGKSTFQKAREVRCTIKLYLFLIKLWDKKGLCETVHFLTIYSST